MLNICVIVAQSLVQMRHRSSLLTKMKKSGKRHFRTVLRALRQFNPPSYQGRLAGNSLGNTWVELGHILDLSEDDPADNMLATVQSCHWADCICHGRKPHVKRVCTGCLWAYYCGPRCQEKCVTSGGLAMLSF